ncbi:MAG: homoserine O-acetyltransferase [Cyclobacteriaceae bacterium]|nr:homoserine O-acetyltransferase [Cyclobacteriaceae bacterium]
MDPKELKYYRPERPFNLERGGVIHGLRIAYQTFGKLNKAKDNVVWVCHALTANSNVPDWWGGVAGPKGFFNTEEHFIICANIIGSCYGSTHPLDIDPGTGEPFYYDYPFVTLRDIVQAHIDLKNHLGIDKIHCCIGGSCGASQVLEFALMAPGKIENMMIIAGSARETPWSIAIHASQRMAIESDCTWGKKDDKAGIKGMKTARGIGLLTYRTQHAYADSQSDSSEVVDNYKADSYIRYQGEKLARRFNAFSYYYLSKTLDTHHIGRDRGSMEEVLGTITTRALILGIDSDILIPIDEQKFMADHIPNAQFGIIESRYGHDGFLIEQQKIRQYLQDFFNE